VRGRLEKESAGRHQFLPTKIPMIQPMAMPIIYATNASAHRDAAEAYSFVFVEII
jgi:hypothetical protein